MDVVILQTSAGPLSVVGRIHADQPRPVLLAVLGSFPPRGYLHNLVDRFPGANVLIVNLPGMAGAPWSDATPAELGVGLTEALGALVADLPIVSFASSTGNLVSLGLRLPNIRRRVLVEPFFQTRHLWPFIANSRERMAANPEHKELANYFRTFFGIGPTSLENRDYRHLLEAITTPSDVVVGQSPLLPPRATEIWPSFTSEEDRAALRANPLVTFHEGPKGTGHNIQSNPAADAVIRRALHAGLLEAAKLCTPQAASA
jgi:hypothetical protein